MSVSNIVPLIDGDIILYTIAHAFNNSDNETLIKKTVNKQIANVLRKTKFNGNYLIFLTGHNNFRKEIYPAYKYNRKDREKPQHLDLIREHLITKWKAIVVNNIEADDALSILQHHYHIDDEVETIICTTDKDLQQVMGRHYIIPYHAYGNDYGDIFEFITPEQALYNLWFQVITGDATDNVKGMIGIGKVGAEKILNRVDKLYNYFDVVMEAYIQNCQPNTIEGVYQFYLNYKMIKLLDKPAYGFEIPNFSSISKDLIYGSK